MNEFLKSKEQLLEELSVNEQTGLTEEQADKNRAKYGANVLTRQKQDSLFKRILEATTEPMIIMLITAGFIALAVNIFRSVTGDEADFLECVGIFLAISLSVMISVIMEGKSAKAFEALTEISKNAAIKALRNGVTTILHQEEVVVGDILLISTGDKLPADGRLLEETGIFADESVLTGESVPSEKDAQKIFTDPKTPLAERSNMLYSGTYITSGYGKLLVTQVGDRTEFGKIAQELDDTEKSGTPLQEKLARLGKTITILGVISATIVFLAQIISFAIHDGLVLEEVMEAFVTSIVLIVAAVPEGLPTIVAVSLSINIIKLPRQNALVKKMIASETIGCINVICSDKTGTLTENKMTVRAFYDSRWHGAVTEPASEQLLHNICLNTTADLGENGTFIGNPSECAMLSFCETYQSAHRDGKTYAEERKDHEIIHAFPFSSELKHMTTICRIDETFIAYAKGSPECILSMCEINAEKKHDIETCIKKAEENAMRVIAFAHKDLPVLKDYEEATAHQQMESGMLFDGFVAISDPLRSEVYEAVRSCRNAGISLKILTGDNIVTVTAIANELHLLENGNYAIEAGEIADMNDSELLRRLPSISVIARSTPATKMRIVNLLKTQGNIVAVTGDGINDAPALKNADVGIAMGISGTEVSKEASDIVLLDDSFATIVKAVEWGRNIYENFKRFISFQLTVNLASVIVVFVSILFGLKAPFTALQLLWINIIMDGPPALTLGLEPNYADLMKRKPTSRNESIISKAMLTKIAVTGIYMSAIFLCQYMFNFLQVPDSQMATTLFTLFVLFQLFHSFNCRELHYESIFTHLLNNKLMLLVVGCTFILQILIIQFAGAFFGTVPLELELWLKLFGVASSVIILSELIKLIHRTAKKLR